MKITTKQQVIDIVVPALLKQGVPSMDVDRSYCRYRGKVNGVVTKCAIGHLIKDEFYCPTFECLRVGHLPIIRAVRKSGININEVDDVFLEQIQYKLHDELFLSENYINALVNSVKSFCKRYRLEVPSCIKDLPGPL